MGNEDFVISFRGSHSPLPPLLYAPLNNSASWFSKSANFNQEFSENKIENVRYANRLHSNSTDTKFLGFA